MPVPSHAFLCIWGAGHVLQSAGEQAAGERVGEHVTAERALRPPHVTRAPAGTDLYVGGGPWRRLSSPRPPMPNAGEASTQSDFDPWARDGFPLPGDRTPCPPGRVEEDPMAGVQNVLCRALWGRARPFGLGKLSFVPG